MRVSLFILFLTVLTACGPTVTYTPTALPEAVGAFSCVQPVGKDGVSNEALLTCTLQTVQPFTTSAWVVSGDNLAYADTEHCQTRTARSVSCVFGSASFVSVSFGGENIRVNGDAQVGSSYYDFAHPSKTQAAIR